MQETTLGYDMQYWRQKTLHHAVVKTVLAVITVVVGGVCLSAALLIFSQGMWWLAYICIACVGLGCFRMLPPLFYRLWLMYKEMRRRKHRSKFVRH